MEFLAFWKLLILSKLQGNSKLLPKTSKESQLVTLAIIIKKRNKVISWTSNLLEGKHVTDSHEAHVRCGVVDVYQNIKGSIHVLYGHLVKQDRKL